MSVQSSWGKCVFPYFYTNAHTHARIHLASQGRAECACSCNKRGALFAAPLEAEQQRQAFSGQIWFPARDNSFYLHSAGERGQKIFRWKLFKTLSVMACPLSAWCILCAIYIHLRLNKPHCQSILCCSNLTSLLPGFTCFLLQKWQWALELAKKKMHKPAWCEWHGVYFVVRIRRLHAKLSCDHKQHALHSLNKV